MSNVINDLKELLEEKTGRYNSPAFIEHDPISIPHLFTKKEDIESIGFIMATIAWGNRNSIIRNGHRLVALMGNQPHDFIMNASEADLRDLQFVHRTFNKDDLAFFVRSMRRLYQKGGLEIAFGGKKIQSGMHDRIVHFREHFLQTDHQPRSEKHISSPLANSACKRINMYLRWMVRSDKRGVDFGIWKSISPAELCLPLDVHTGRISRALGLLTRKQNDWKALEEVMTHLRRFDPHDPCKYDFALFGMGVHERDEREISAI